MATHSSFLAWKIPWTEEPGGLQFMGSASGTTGISAHTHSHTHTVGRRQVHNSDQGLSLCPVPALLPHLRIHNAC